MNLARILTTLGINAVPALGWFWGDWNSGTTLAVYWVETVLASLLIALRIVAHRRVVPVRGHSCYQTRQDSKPNRVGIPFLEHFLPVSLMFSAAHGVFLAVIGLLLTANGRGAEMRLSFPDIAIGCGIILAIQMADFLIDLIRLKSRPFRWIEAMAEQNFGRSLVLHLTIMIGMLAGGLSGGARGFFLVFVTLKTMNDLSTTLPQYDPEEAPRWLCRLLDKVPNLGNSRSQPFGDYWKEGKVGERARRARNEQE